MKSLEIVKRKIIDLEDELQHYTMVEYDNFKSKLIKLELEDQKLILRDLETLEKIQTSMIGDKNE